MHRLEVRPRAASDNRSGTVLVITAVGLLSIVGMMGIALDTGLMLGRYRQAYNAADAAALAAAQALIQNESVGEANSAGERFVTGYNNLNGATVSIRIPPSSGPYAGDTNFAEAIVSNPSETRLMQALGAGGTNQLKARAVAGHEETKAKAGVIALNPAVTPGIGSTGQGMLSVNGIVITNSLGGGVDQNGAVVSGLNGSGASVTGQGVIRAGKVKVAGGVNSPAGFIPRDAATTNHLECRNPIYSDPLRRLRTPNVTNGVNPTSRGLLKVSSTNARVTAQPGIYSSIEISTGTVTFNPGIYVIRGGQLRITGGNVTARGCMFYLTALDYDPYTGLPDVHDGETHTPLPNNTNGGVTITSIATMSGITDPTSPFCGMLIYMRRNNSSQVEITGNCNEDQMTGTVYAKWSQLKLSGQGVMNVQFCVGNVRWSGNSSMTIDCNGRNIGRARVTFLVE
jgi:Flp pilus assembly protein TadG